MVVASWRLVIYSCFMVPVFSSLVWNKNLGNHRFTRTTKFSFLFVFSPHQMGQTYLELNTSVVFASVFTWFLDIKIFCQHFQCLWVTPWYPFSTKEMIYKALNSQRICLRYLRYLRLVKSYSGHLLSLCWRKTKLRDSGPCFNGMGVQA